MLIVRDGDDITRDLCTDMESMRSVKHNFRYYLRLMRAFGGKLGIWSESSRNWRCLNGSQSSKILHMRYVRQRENRGRVWIEKYEFGVRRNFGCLEILGGISRKEWKV